MNSQVTDASPFGLITANEAAGRLGVSLASLYAYVSRGLVRSVPRTDDLRCRLYVATDVEALVRQKTLTRGPVAASAAALNMGLPILETRVSGIVAGRPVYRGHDAIDLAETWGLEDAARILWETGDHDPFAATRFCPWLEPEWPQVAKAMEAASPTDRAQALLSLLATRPWSLVEQPPHENAARLVRAIANAVVGRRLEPDVLLHHALALAWGRPEAADAIRRALVLSAEHELNPSTFAVRVVASTGASLAAAVIAGLAALGGSRHGALRPEFDAIDELIRTEPGAGVTTFQVGATTTLQVGATTAFQVSRDNPPPGFGHPVYPDGDPRATALLKHLDVPPSIARITATIEQVTALRPNLSAALWLVEKTHHLPPGAALALIAVGRSAGWIAHAIEQREADAMIRPRAKFIRDAKPEPEPA